MKPVDICLGAAIAFLLCSIGYAAWTVYHIPTYQDRLMAQCVADGLKEYQCYEKLKP